MMEVTGDDLKIPGRAAAQTSGELHSRCGEPDRERFAARPGVVLTVQYGSDGLACQVLLESPQPLLNDEKNLSMSSDVVTEILEKSSAADIAWERDW
jgi:hypothetical protein